MNRLLLLPFLFAVAAFLGCTNSPSKEESNKDSIIKLQEERISQLEKQLSSRNNTTIDTSTRLEAKQINVKNTLDYFTIGSSEDEVLAVQGQPTSIEKILDSKIFFYGNSSITFNRGIVESYRDDGNLKIKIGTRSKKFTSSNIDDNELSSNTILRTSKKNKSESQDVKYIYFTFMTTELEMDIDPITGKLKNKENDYSEIYSISDYTYKKEQALEFCLTKNYKEWTGKQVFLTPHSYNDRQSALTSWNSEKGRLYNQAMCNQLMQIGIIAQ